MFKNLLIIVVLFLNLISPLTPVYASNEITEISFKSNQINIKLSPNEFQGFRIQNLRYINEQEILVILSKEKSFDLKKVITMIINTKNGDVKLKNEYDNVKNVLLNNERIHILFMNKAIELSTSLVELKKTSFDLQVKNANFLTMSDDGKYIAFADLQNQQLCIYDLLIDKIILQKECLNIPESLTFLNNTTIGYNFQGSWDNYKTLNLLGTENEYKTANINFDIKNNNGIAFSYYPEYSGSENDSIIKLLEQGQIVFKNTEISNKGFFRLSQDGNIIIALSYPKINERDYTEFVIKLYDYDTVQLIGQHNVNLIDANYLVEQFAMSVDNKKFVISEQLNLTIVNLIS